MDYIYVGTKDTRKRVDKAVAIGEVAYNIAKVESVVTGKPEDSNYTFNDCVLRVMNELEKKYDTLTRFNLKSKSGISQILDCFSISCNKRIKKWNFSRNKFYSLIREDYGKFRGFLIDTLVDLRRKGNFDKEILGEDLDYFDNYYGILHSKHFAMNIKDIEKLVSDKPEDISDITEDDLQSICDMTIDIMIGDKFTPMTIKVLKTTYTLVINGENKDVYNVALLATEPKSSMNVGNIASFSFILDMYPRVYVSESSNVVRCKGCKVANKRNYDMNWKPEAGGEIKAGLTDIEYCMVGARRASDCPCNDTLLFKETVGTKIDIPLDSVTIMKIIAHVVRTYKHRGSIVRKNTKHKDLAKKAVRAISVASNDTKNEKLVSLKEYVRYERREKYEWQGGHHSSPVEHERREHVRRYRDKEGNVIKEITVRGTTVNKGGEKGIYVVK